MKRKVSIFLSMTIAILIFINSGCNNGDSAKTNVYNSDSILDEIPEVKMGKFYDADTNRNNSVVLADTIIYNVIIKNPDTEDEWQEYNLKYFNKKAFINIIFNAIYNGKLTPYNYQTEKVMSIEEVKQMEKEHPRKEIGNIQFTETWYLNEDSYTFGKKIISIMMAYERINTTGEVRYKSGIQVYFNKEKNLNMPKANSKEQ